MINLPPFKNETCADFSDERTAQAMLKAIEHVESQLGREYPIVINGERIKTGESARFDQPFKILANCRPRASGNERVGR